MNPLLQAGVFLIDTLFAIYILILMMRLLLQVVRADFYNPLSQFVVKATNPPLVPLRRLIPGWGGFDLALIFLLTVFTIFKIGVIFWMQHSRLPGIGGLIVWSLGDLTSLAINVFFFAIFIQIILSWLSPMQYNPFVGLLNNLTDPLLRPARRFIPAIGGFDISPIPVMLGLQLLIIIVASPIIHTGMSLALR